MFRKEIKRSEEEMKAYIGYVEKKWESRVEELGDKINVLMEKVNKLELDKEESEKSTRMESEVGSVGDNGSERLYGGRWSGTGGRSVKSNEDRLSEREVSRIKRMVVDRDREDRRCNIAIRGWTEGCGEGRVNLKEAVEQWLRVKLQVKCKVLSCWKSGLVQK